MADVIFKRKTSTEIASLPIVDGSVIFNTTDKDIFMDNGTTRERYGGGNLSTIDVVNDVSTAIAVTKTDVPAGCGTIKELDSSIKTINNALATLNSNLENTNKRTFVIETSGALVTVPFDFSQYKKLIIGAVYQNIAMSQELDIALVMGYSAIGLQTSIYHSTAGTINVSVTGSSLSLACNNFLSIIDIYVENYY